MKTGLISVMMPAYNAERYIRQAIESVLEQSYSNWELIVVNDGSTDATAEIIGRFTDPRIKIVHQKNAGEPAARNVALKHMNGEFVAFLDADDIFLPQHLEELAGYLLNHPDRDAVYADGYYVDDDGKRLQTLSSRRRGPFEGRVFEQIVRGSDVFGPPGCVALRNRIILQHNLLFDERLMFAADTDFLIRFSDVADFGYIDRLTYLYRLHITSASSRFDLRGRAPFQAICRTKAVKMPNFQSCSADTQFAVFYDLLINLLEDSPQSQAEVTQWPEFRHLPPDLQARLLRLLASEYLISGGKHVYISDWISRARKLSPRDLRGAMLSTLYDISPVLCRLVIQASRSTRRMALSASEG